VGRAAARAGSGASPHANAAALGQPWGPDTPRSAPSMPGLGATRGHRAARYRLRAGLGSGAGTRLAQAEHTP